MAPSSCSTVSTTRMLDGARRELSLFEVAKTPEPHPAHLRALRTSARLASCHRPKSLQDFQPSLYAERIRDVRGDDGLNETYVLQGYSQGKWLTIKPIVLLLGEEPELDFGECADCGTELEEGEFALGTLCDSCRERELEAREAATW